MRQMWKAAWDTLAVGAELRIGQAVGHEGDVDGGGTVGGRAVVGQGAHMTVAHRHGGGDGCSCGERHTKHDMS